MKTDRKYELTDETIRYHGRTLHRIRALRDFGNVERGDLGGYVESENNLSHFGTCWVYNQAKVMHGAHIYEAARIFDSAYVHGAAWISGSVQAFDSTEVSGSAEILDSVQIYGSADIFGTARVSGSAKIKGSAYIKDTDDCISISPIGSEGGSFTAYKTKTGIECTRGCFKGTLEEFTEAVRKKHGDNQYGKEYQTVIDLVRLRLK